jgi:hypothetical protein
MYLHILQVYAAHQAPRVIAASKETIMESWRKVWRDGLVPNLSTEGLDALASALASDDPRLLQGATTTPPPLQCVQDWPVEAACVLGYCGWQGDGLVTVAEVEESFARLCFEADQLLGEPAACRWFLNWYDETPREEMCRLLLEEVRHNLAERRDGQPSEAVRDGGSVAAA